MIERHINLTDADLAQRLATSNISSVSRFADRSTAKSAVSAAVDANQATIQGYLASNTKGYLAVEYTSSTLVGSTLLRGASSPVPASEVRVVIARDPTMPTGYNIISRISTLMNSKFPVIKNMFSAYFSQDFDLVFGSADEAIFAFSSHADHIDKERALVELDVLLNADLDEEQLKNIIFDELGCCYFYPAEWSDGTVWLRHVSSLLKK